MAARRQQGADDQFQKREPRRLWAGLHDLADPSAKGRREAGVVMRFHGVCGRLVAHPLHGDLPPGDTLVRNPHRSSKSTGLNRVQFENHDSVCPTVTLIKERNYDFQTRRGLETPVAHSKVAEKLQLRRRLSKTSKTQAATASSGGKNLVGSTFVSA